VASGDPSTDGAVLWTRVRPTAGASTELVLVVWEEGDDGVTSEVQRGTVVTDPERDGTARFTVTGLRPGTRHAYRFEHRSDHSRTGRFRTLSADGRPVCFAVVSCAKLNAGHFNAYRHITERAEVDFVVHLGDYIYEAANKPPASQTPGADIGRPFDP